MFALSSKIYSEFYGKNPLILRIEKPKDRIYSRSQNLA